MRAVRRLLLPMFAALLAIAAGWAGASANRSCGPVADESAVAQRVAVPTDASAEPALVPDAWPGTPPVGLRSADTLPVAISRPSRLPGSGRISELAGGACADAAVAPWYVAHRTGAVWTRAGASSNAVSLVAQHVRLQV